jgi:hypothetical protein
MVFVVTTLYGAAARRVTAGRPVAPLDDAYITYQYAKQMARGYPYQYNTGDVPTTGMTSFLFTLLLAGVYRLGMTGEALAAVAVRLGVLWLGLTAWLVYRVMRRLLQPHPVGRQGVILLTVTLTLALGTLQWGYFNGMETGLFTVLVLAALDALLDRRYGMGSAWLCLAGLTRPEGLILTLVTCGVIFVGGLIQKCMPPSRQNTVVTEEPRRVFPWRPLVILSFSLLGGILPSLIGAWATGDFSAASLQAKSWLYNVPAYPREIIRSIFVSYWRILRGFVGVVPLKDWFMPPGVFIVALVGWGALLWRRQVWPLLLTLAWFFLGTLATATLITATWHVGRYQVPFVPLITLMSGYGMSFILEGVRYLERLYTDRPGHRPGSVFVFRAVPWLLGLALLVPAFYTTYQGVKLYRQAIYTVSHQQLALADWINVHIPAQSYIGVHDVGAIRYVGQRPTYDLIGLTTAGATLPWRHGSGSVFETMEHAPQRPAYFVTYPDAFSIPYFVATDLFDDVLFSVNVPEAAVASAGPVQRVWRADWGLADSGPRFYQADIHARIQGLHLVDSLDVADLEDEAAHTMTWWQDTLRPGFPTEVQHLTYRTPVTACQACADVEGGVLDGGRLLNGGLTMQVRTEPQRALWIVSRLHAREAGGVHVEVNGNLIGSWRYPPVPGQWLETLFYAPADVVTQTKTMVTLAVDETVTVPTSHYAPYYFWFLQGVDETAREPTYPFSEDLAEDFRGASISHPISVTFGSDLMLGGFDVPTQVWHPGDIVPVTLYWYIEACDSGSSSDAKVFLHLYGDGGNLVTQSDGWAYYDTRPPYTWQPGEIVVDPRALALPADLPSGQYALAVGLYTSDGRLPVRACCGRQWPEDRVFLINLEIE